MRLIVVGDCVSLKHKTHQASAVKDQSVDHKGIKRGACNEKDCGDCDAYFHDASKGAQCQYCGCFPTKHRRIDDVAKSPEQCRLPKIKELEPCLPPEIHIIDNGSDTSVYEVDEDGNVIPDDSWISSMNSLEASPPTSSNNASKATPVIKNKSFLSSTTPQQGVSGSGALVSSLSKQSLTSKNMSNALKESQRNLNSTPTFDQMISQMSQVQLYEFCVPSHLPMRSSLPMNTESLSKSDALIIIRWIAWSMCNLRVTSEPDFVQVATLALKRYPSLESALSSEKGVDGLVQFLKQFLGFTEVEKKRKEIAVPLKQQQQQKQQQSNKENTVTSTKQYENVKLHIQKEMEKLSPSMAMLRTFLTSCRKDRRTRLSLNKQNYSSQLQEFPCLQLQELVLWEFIQQEQLQCSEQDLKRRWLDALPNMASYFLSQSEKIYSPLTEEEATLEILQCLTSPFFFGAETVGKKRSSLVIEVFKGNILPLFACPQRGDPPRLFSVGNDENITTYVYVDGNAVYKGPIVDAIVHIVAVYFVFDFAPSPDTATAFAFIYGILMNEKALQKYKDYPSVVKALEVVRKPLQ